MCLGLFAFSRRNDADEEKKGGCRARGGGHECQRPARQVDHGHVSSRTHTGPNVRAGADGGKPLPHRRLKTRVSGMPPAPGDPAHVTWFSVNGRVARLALNQ